jgi:hypothetical protein
VNRNPNQASWESATQSGLSPAGRKRCPKLEAHDRLAAVLEPGLVDRTVWLSWLLQKIPPLASRQLPHQLTDGGMKMTDE